MPELEAFVAEASVGPADVTVISVLIEVAATQWPLEWIVVVIVEVTAMKPPVPSVARQFSVLLTPQVLW